MPLIARASLLFAATLLVVSLAAAEGPPVQLRWTAPQGCPDEADVLMQIARMLAGRSRPSERIVSATVRQDRDRWRATLETTADGQRSVRELEAASCAAVAEATALVVAVSIDPDVALGPSAGEVAAPLPDASPRSEAADAGGADSAVPRPAPLPPEHATRYGVDVHAGGGVTFGLLPSATPGIHGGVFGARGRIGARLDAQWLPPTDAGADATFGALRIRALVCPELLARGAFHLAPGAGLETDIVWGRGRGVTDPRSATAAFFAPVVALHGSYDVTSRLAIGLGGDVVFPLQRPSFELAGRPIFRVGPILGGAQAEARVRW